jgi:PAS domain S-box-containing protein
MCIDSDLYRILFESAIEPILLLEDGRIVDANAIAFATYGRTRKEMIGQSLSAFSPPTQPDGSDSTKSLKDQIEVALTNGIHQFIWECQGSGGATFSVQATLQSVKTGDGPVMSISFGPVEHDLPEQSLERAEEERYRSLLDNVQDGYYEVDLAGNHTFVNNSICNMFGYSENELLNMNYREYMDEATAEQVFGVFNQVFKTGKPVSSLEYKITGKDGKERFIQTSVSLLHESDGQPAGFRGFVRDTTERTRTEERLQQAYDELEERVAERTAELARANDELEEQIAERERADKEIKQLLEQRSRQVQLSTRVAQEIAEAADLDDLYLRVVTQVKEQFNYYHTQLLRYDPALDTVALVVGYGEVGDKMLAMHHSIPMGVGLIGTAAATGKSLISADVNNDPTWQPNPLLPYTKGELTVPITLGGEVLGVLDVQSDATNALDKNDLLLLEGLCGQIAVAIESTRLRQEMESRLRELGALQRHMSRDGWEAYQGSEKSSFGYQFGHAGVQPLLPSSSELTLDEEHLEPSTNGKSGLSQIPSGPDAIANTLAVRGETFGQLGIVDDPEHPLSQEEKDLLNAISNQVAEALEIARLFEQTQEALAHQERLTAELETVAEVGTAASTLLDVDTLLQSVVDLAKRSFGLYHAHVYLIDEASKQLVLRAGAGSVGRLMVLEGRAIDVNAPSLVARAARERQAFIENNVAKTTDFLPHPMLPGTRAELVVPLVVGDYLLGVLDLQSDAVGYFTAKDFQIQKILAAQISVAVQNAFRFAEQVETAAKLRQVDQLKSEFLASMSHELRTPLNSIIGFADVLLEGLDGELNERMEEDVRLIRDSGAHLRALIGDILDMSKIEAGRMDLRYEEVDMRQIANDIVATAGPLAHEKSLELYLNLAVDVATVEADRTRLRQVLWNIVGNAIKFTEKGYVTLSLHMEQDDLVVSVRDTGIGIKPEDIGTVFEQFRQVDGSLNRTVGGTGLGLPITKNLVELHGGQIWAESVFGEGATFAFTIPRYKKPLRRDTTPLPVGSGIAIG